MSSEDRLPLRFVGFLVGQFMRAGLCADAAEAQVTARRIVDDWHAALAPDDTTGEGTVDDRPADCQHCPSSDVHHRAARTEAAPAPEDHGDPDHPMKEYSRGFHAAMEAVRSGNPHARRGVGWPEAAPALDVGTLAAIIRRVDGNHDLGAAALAEAILAAIDTPRGEV